MTHQITGTQLCRSVTLAAAALIAIVAVLMLAPAARASDPPIFFTICDVSHYGKDDPIVHPGEPGTSHDHMFSGAWSTNANSTFASLQRSGTTCELEADTAAYWAPTLLDGNNNPIRGTFFAYFTAGIHEGPVDRSAIKPLPSGLRIVADASGSRPGESGWHCGDPGSIASRTTIPTCPGGLNKLQALIGFPDCWDGVHLDSPDHRSHMAYAGRNAAGARIGCPTSHPVPVVSLSLKIRYGSSDGGPGVHLSSGGPETLHADFFNAWKQPEFERLTKRCINDEFRNGEPCRNPQDSTRTYEPTPNPNFPNATQPASAPASAPVEPGCSPAPVLTPAVWTSGAVTIGASDQVSIPDVLGLDNSYSLRVSYTGNPTPGDKTLLMLGGEARLYVNGNSLRGRVSVGGVGEQLVASFAPGVRQEFILTRSGAAVKLYIDGKVVASAVGWSALHDLGPGALGAFRDGNVFYGRAPGTYHEAAIFDRDLFAP